MKILTLVLILSLCGCAPTSQQISPQRYNEILKNRVQQSKIPISINLMDEKEVIAALTGIFEDRVREAPDMRTPLRVAYWEWCGEKFKDGTLKKLRRQYAKLHPDISKLEAILLEGGAIKPGMKAQWVKGTWGTPSAVSTTEIPGIISEVWIYRSTDQAYTMHNGKVWAIHKTPSR